MYNKLDKVSSKCNCYIGKIHWLVIIPLAYNIVKRSVDMGWCSITPMYIIVHFNIIIWKSNLLTLMISVRFAIISLIDFMNFDELFGPCVLSILNYLL